MTYELTGLQKVYLDSVRERITVDDLPEGLSFDDEGTVLSVLNWAETLDAIERSVRGEVD